jgi:hypothetical protein
MAKYISRVVAAIIFTATFTVVVVEPLSQPHKYPHQDTWTVEDSKGYAYDRLSVWRNKQMSCLSKLWGKESAWRPEAYNKIKVQGRNAGGIPQLLGLDPATPPTRQIERGLEYIYHRYHTPCRAWQFFLKNGWH